MISVGRRVWVAAWDLLLVLLVHGLVCVIVGMPCVLLPPLDVQNKHGGTAAIWAAYNEQPDCLAALIDNKANLDIQVRGVMTHGRVALLVNGLIDPLRRVPLDWSIEWCIGWGVKTGPLSDFAIRWNQMH